MAVEKCTVLFDGRYTTVKDYVRERRRAREMSVPLSHAPGQAQCGFGEARVVIGHCLVLDLREPPGAALGLPCPPPRGEGHQMQKEHE